MNSHFTVSDAIHLLSTQATLRIPISEDTRDFIV